MNTYMCATHIFDLFYFHGGLSAVGQFIQESFSIALCRGGAGLMNLLFASLLFGALPVQDASRIGTPAGHHILHVNVCKSQAP